MLSRLSYEVFYYAISKRNSDWMTFLYTCS